MLQRLQRCTFMTGNSPRRGSPMGCISSILDRDLGNDEDDQLMANVFSTPTGRLQRDQGGPNISDLYYLMMSMSRSIDSNRNPNCPITIPNSVI